MAEAFELLVTRMDGRPVAVLVESIFEVINAVETMTFIDRPECILGLINLRGDIVPVHDLRFHMTGESRGLIPSDQILIMRDGDTKIGVAVDSVETVKTFQEEQLFAQSLSPNAFKILKIRERQVCFDEIRSILEM
ncbi:MAG: chemotaxis protein CheW [Candidatus Melainabacteria bacterium]|nr:chemotaxis protein CheW [Candidatus Melainabacteria bacterium]